MAKPKHDTTYGLQSSPDEHPEVDDEEEEPTEVTKLHELLEEKLANSREKLDDVARKGAVLKMRLRKKGSVQRMQAVLSDKASGKESS